MHAATMTAGARPSWLGDSGSTQPYSKRMTLTLLGIASCCLILVAATWVAILNRVRYEHDRAVEAAVRQTGNLAMAFEEHTRRTLEGVDQTLLFLARNTGSMGGCWTCAT